MSGATSGGNEQGPPCTSSGSGSVTSSAHEEDEDASSSSEEISESDVPPDVEGRGEELEKACPKVKTTKAFSLKLSDPTLSSSTREGGKGSKPPEEGGRGAPSDGAHRSAAIEAGLRWVNRTQPKFQVHFVPRGGPLEDGSSGGVHRHAPAQERHHHEQVSYLEQLVEVSGHPRADPDLISRSFCISSSRIAHVIVSGFMSACGYISYVLIRSMSMSRSDLCPSDAIWMNGRHSKRALQVLGLGPAQAGSEDTPPPPARHRSRRSGSYGINLGEGGPSSASVTPEGLIPSAIVKVLLEEKAADSRRAPSPARSPPHQGRSLVSRGRPSPPRQGRSSSRGRPLPLDSGDDGGERFPLQTSRLSDDPDRRRRPLREDPDGRRRSPQRTHTSFRSSEATYRDQDVGRDGRGYGRGRPDGGHRDGGSGRRRRGEEPSPQIRRYRSRSRDGGSRPPGSCMILFRAIFSSANSIFILER